MSVVPKEDGRLVPVDKKVNSILQDPFFDNVKNKAQSWLGTPTLPVGKEMDSVFFNNDRFELLVDTRGYRPEELRCTVGPDCVEVRAERQEVTPGAQRCVATTRCYQLPQNVLPQQAICCLSSEGILLIAVPWQK